VQLRHTGNNAMELTKPRYRFFVVKTQIISLAILNVTSSSMLHINLVLHLNDVEPLSDLPAIIVCLSIRSSRRFVFQQLWVITICIGVLLYPLCLSTMPLVERSLSPDDEIRRKKLKRRYNSSPSLSTSDDDHKRRKRRRTSRHRKEDKKRRRRKKYHRDDDSSSSNSSSSVDDSHRKRKKKAKKRDRKTKKLEDQGADRSQDTKREHKPHPSEQQPTCPSDETPDAPKKRSFAMAPMSREQYDAQQKQVREVYDEESGRYRLVRGNGEIIERIVSRSAHEQINRGATRGDGTSFAKNVLAAMNKRR
jgi:Nuclear RNA-splicing-associated protein